MSHTFQQLKSDRSLWSGIETLVVLCDWCGHEFEVKYGTIFNAIGRDASGLYCCRKHAGEARAKATQEKYSTDGGKVCKRCGEFKTLDNFWSMNTPPYYRAECKACRNFKPARKYNYLKDAALKKGFKFTLTLNQFLNFQGQHCFYCGEEVKYISLDLIQSEKGYTKDNCLSICGDCKDFKGELEQAQFLQQCFKICHHLKGEEENES